MPKPYIDHYFIGPVAIRFDFQLPEGFLTDKDVSTPTASKCWAATGRLALILIWIHSRIACMNALHSTNA